MTFSVLNPAQRYNPVAVFPHYFKKSYGVSNTVYCNAVIPISALTVPDHHHVYLSDGARGENHVSQTHYIRAPRYL